MVKRFIMVTLAFLMIGVQAFAQSMITGKVVDTKGDPVAAAGIQIKGTNIGVITDRLYPLSVTRPRMWLLVIRQTSISS